MRTAIVEMIIDSAPARNRVFTQLGTGGIFRDGNLAQRRRQAACVQNIDKKIHLLLGEVAGDLSVILNAALNIRGRLDRIVQNNSQLIFQTAAFVGHVAAGQIAEQLGPRRVEREIYAISAELIEARCGSCQIFPTHVVGIDHRQRQYFPFLTRPRNVIGVHVRIFVFFKIQRRPLRHQFVFSVGVFDGDVAPFGLLSQLDISGVLRRADVRQNAELQRPGGADLVLNNFDFRLFHLGDDHFHAIGTHAAHGHFFLTAGIHALADAADHQIHVGRAGSPHAVHQHLFAIS